MTTFPTDDEREVVYGYLRAHSFDDAQCAECGTVRWEHGAHFLDFLAPLIRAREAAAWNAGADAAWERSTPECTTTGDLPANHSTPIDRRPTMTTTDPAVQAAAEALSCHRVDITGSESPDGAWCGRHKSRAWGLVTCEEVEEAVEAARPAIEREAKAEAWDEGANAAWQRSTPEVNGLRYHWRTHGEPRNPYREADQ